MGFSQQVKENVLIKCKRHCVLCEQPKGIKMEVHHIIPKAKGGSDDIDNAIPLCFDCHQEVGGYNPEHPKGNKYTYVELKQRRDNFYERLDKNEFPVYSYTINQKDKELFEEISNIFSDSNLIYYLKEFDLGKSFDNKIFYPLNELEMKKDYPKYFFVDNELESAKNELFNSLSDFLYFKATKTFPQDNGEQKLEVYPREDFEKYQREFNSLATNVFENYQKLYKLGIKKMY